MNYCMWSHRIQYNNTHSMVGTKHIIKNVNIFCISSRCVAGGNVYQKVVISLSFISRFQGWACAPSALLYIKIIYEMYF